jgi:hypothetical protein
MGKLAIYGAIAGAGKGLSGIAKRELDEQERMAADARQYQMQRQRDKAAQEQRALDAAAAEDRLQQQLKSQSEQLQTRIEATEARDVAQQAHEVQIEEMRQTAQTARETMRITEKEDRFTTGMTKESTDFLPGGGIRKTPAKSSITDNVTQTTYTQEATRVDNKSVVIYVPFGFESPTTDQVRAGEVSKAWLLKPAPTPEIENERMFQYLGIYGYLPPEYFASKRRGQARKITEKGATTTTQPAAQ